MSFARYGLGCALAAVLLAGCRRNRHRAAAEAAPLAESAVGDAAPPSPLGEVAPVRAAEASQARWRQITHGPRPRGVERWRFDLTPREALGEPATDGRTVFLAAARLDAEGPSEGEIFAFDLRDGSLRWHTAVEGLHGEPIEVIDGVVLVDTIRHCIRRGSDTPGSETRPCLESAPGAMIGLDAVTGVQRYRTAAASDAAQARWAIVSGSRSYFMHDGNQGFRELSVGSGGLGARLSLGASIVTATGVHDDLLVVVEGRRGTELQRRATAAALATRPRWSRPLPYRSSCQVVAGGSVAVVPAFTTPNLSGAARGVSLMSGADAWVQSETPLTVETCGAIEGPMFYQVLNGSLTTVHFVDGRSRASHRLGAQVTSDFAAAMDGIFYHSVSGRLSGIDVVGGHESVRVETGAHRVEGMVLWGGRGAVTTRAPGLVVGFE
ncbi:MAG: PQQ-binding-like beta-propeller repeat protein [Myxococcales bacterium]|nr:PQQ-binding-like beta-propeller repeat protein [Myxococcales bacterium]